jgi:hypothetical protein
VVVHKVVGDLNWKLHWWLLRHMEQNADEGVITLVAELLL